MGTPKWEIAFLKVNEMMHSSIWVKERNVAETCREQGDTFTAVHWEDNLGVSIPEGATLSKTEERMLLQDNEKLKQSLSKCR